MAAGSTLEATGEAVVTQIQSLSSMLSTLTTACGTILPKLAVTNQCVTRAEN